MSEKGEEVTQRTIERVARESHGRLMAYLGLHTRDLASAEEALSDALVKALITGPRDGVPQNPEAWLLTTGRHSIIDAVRHERVVSESEPTLQLLKENFMEITSSAQFPDERLKLLFVCAHPAIDPAMHTPLMLQTVLRCAHRCQLKALMNANTFSAGLRYFEHELNCGGSKSCNRRNGKNDNSYGLGDFQTRGTPASLAAVSADP